MCECLLRRYSNESSKKVMKYYSAVYSEVFSQGVNTRALHGVGNPYGYGYGVDFGWIWIFFS